MEGFEHFHVYLVNKLKTIDSADLLNAWFDQLNQYSDVNFDKYWKLSSSLIIWLWLFMILSTILYCIVVVFLIKQKNTKNPTKANHKNEEGTESSVDHQTAQSAELASGEHYSKIEIHSFETMTSQNGSTYIAYVIQITVATVLGDPLSRSRTLRRRYSEFEVLYNKLRSKYPTVERYPFPPKTLLYTRTERVNAFHDFLQILGKLQPIPKEFEIFLQCNENDKFMNNQQQHGNDEHTMKNRSGFISTSIKNVVDLSDMALHRKKAALATTKHKLEETMQWKTWLTSEGVREGCCSIPRAGNPIGELKVQVLEGFDLPASDYGVTSDPYCVVTLSGFWSHGQEWSQHMRAKGSTSVRTATINPKWGSRFAFIVPRSGATVRFEVFDWDATGKDDKLGVVEVPLESLLDGQEVDCWLKLKLVPFFDHQLKKLRRREKPNLLNKVPENRGLGEIGGGVTLNSNGSNGPVERRASHQSNTLISVASGVVEGSKDAVVGVAHGVVARGAVMGDVAAGLVGMKKWIGKDACIHVKLKFEFAPWGDIVSRLVWQEDPIEPVPVEFDIDLLLTEIFKTLRLIRPIIRYFTSPDQTGLLDHFNWLQPLRSGFWLTVLTILFVRYPQYAWSMVQVYFLYVSHQQYYRRKHNLLKFRVNQKVRRLYKLSPDQPLPTAVVHDLNLLGVTDLSVEDYKESGGQVNLESGKVFQQLRREVQHIKHEIENTFKKSIKIEPDFYTQPTDLIFEPCVKTGVFYDSDEEKECNWNWMPEDGFEECKFEVKGMVGSLLDQLISILNAPWMNTVLNIVLKLNKHLCFIHSLFNWQNIKLCKNVYRLLIFSILLHSVMIPFNIFILILIWFLYLNFTSFFKQLIRYLALPLRVPLRFKHLEQSKKKIDECDTVSGDLRKLIISTDKLKCLKKP